MKILITLFLYFISHWSSGQSTYSTNFEDGSKTGTYTTGNDVLSGITWTLQESLIGTDAANDRFNGLKSLRLRYRTNGTPGIATMNSDVTGIETISFKYARFGTDTDPPVIKVEYSTNSGSTWIQAGSDIDTDGVTTLTDWSHTINVVGSVRIRLRTVNGTNGRRANIDDLAFTSTADTTPPVFENSTPSSSSLTHTSFTLGTDIDEAGTIYYVLLADGATAPSSAQVKAGTDGNDASGITSASQLVNSGGFTHDFNISSLSAGSSYDIYVVAEDDEGSPNLQASPTLLEVTTTSTLTWDGSSSNDWATAANWTPATIPGSGTDVTIPSGLTNYPTASGAVTVNTVTMASGTSLIANSTFAGAVTYNRTVQFVSGNLKGWYLMASPVSGETYDNDYVTANNIAANGTNRGIASYNTSGDSWLYLQQNSSGTFNNGQGYSIKRTSNGDVGFTGTLNTNNAGVDVVLSNSLNRFNLLGNPYTSYISSATFLNNESAISETKTLWVFNQTLGVNGEYEVKDISDAMIIAPAQGFFVRANTAGGTFNFAEANQSHNSSDTFQKSVSNLVIKLWINDGTIKNYARVKYLPNASKGFDVGFDGELFSGAANTFAVYSHLLENNQEKKYQLQSLPNSNYENMVIPIGVIANSGKEITFSTETLNLPAGLKVYIEDRETNTFTRLDEANSNYKITLNTTLSGIGRFYLHTRSSALSTNDITLEGVSIYSNNNTLRITGMNSENAKVKIYSVLGKKVLESSFSSKGVSDINLPKLNTGVYIVQLTSEKGKINKKIVLE
ncbi:T9SS type A sorting domain-containing protein [Polaribacter porphyrae]|uniref:T9SS type A sorting domain-containing protein n=1 Tax=Polaribacter porphyrae TaxID=1137780 RepID=UPI00147588D3|nr:T9SS type A sorting domain-containing protein [Polaribacter porphyrae]